MYFLIHYRGFYNITENALLFTFLYVKNIFPHLAFFSIYSLVPQLTFSLIKELFKSDYHN